MTRDWKGRDTMNKRDSERFGMDMVKSGTEIARCKEMIIKKVEKKSPKRMELKVVFAISVFFFFFLAFYSSSLAFLL